MKTFLEAVQIKNNLRLFEQLLIELELRGVSSVEVVDWLVFDDQFDLHEGIGDWFRQGINNLASGNVNYGNIANTAQTGGGAIGNVAGGTIGAGLAGAGGFVRGALGSAANQIAGGLRAGLGMQDGTHKTSAGQFGGQQGAPGTGAHPAVHQALANLDSYSKKTAGRVQKILGDPGFGAAITQLLNMMRDPNTFNVQSPTNGTNIVTTGESHTVSDSDELTSLIESTNSLSVYLEQKNLAETVINEFAIRNIDPTPFVEWYVEEGYALDPEQFNENLWDRFTGWLGQKTGWTAAQNKRDLQLTNYLLANLQQLQQQKINNPQFNDQLNVVMQYLQKAVPVLSGGDAAAGGGDASGGDASNAPAAPTGPVGKLQDMLNDPAFASKPEWQQEAKKIATQLIASGQGGQLGSSGIDLSKIGLPNLDLTAWKHVQELQNLMKNTSDLQDPKNKAQAKAIIADIKKRFPAFDPAAFSIDANKFEWLYRELLQDQLFEEDQKFFESLFGSTKKSNWFAF